MIGPVVSAALWAVLAGLALSLVTGIVVAAIIRFFRPAAATRQVLWSIALAAAGIAPAAILAAMLLRGAAGAAKDDMPSLAPAISQHVSTGTKRNPRDAASFPAPSAHADSAAAAAPVQHATLHVPAPPELAPFVAQAIVVAWALGVLAGLTGLGRSLVRVRGLKLRSSALDGDLAGELPWLTDLPGREIYLRLSYETETPIAVGFRRPVILIPTEMATAAGLTSIEPLVMHEYAHLSRYDDWTNLIQRAIERIFWFNPLVWMLGRRLALEREVAADEAVVARTHDAKKYASALWRMAQEMRMPEHMVVAPGAMLTRKQISVRIERLLEDAPVTGRRFGAIAFAAAALALTGVAGVAATAPPIVLAPPEPQPAAATANAASTAAAQASPKAPAAPAAQAVSSAATAVPKTSPLPNAAELAEGVLGESDVTNLKKLGSQIRADVARQLAEQHRQLAEQHRQALEQRRQIAEGRRQLADGADGADASDRTAPAGPLTREIIAACTACTFARRDLHGLNLSNLTLSGDDFGHANLDGANFGHSTLRGVSFSHASLTGAQFTAAQLTGVDLSHTKLDGANLTEASLTGVDLTGASMNGTITTGLRLVGSALP